MFAGAGTLNAANGVTINDAVTATAGTLTIDADTDNNGSGTFMNNAAVTATNLDITANDAAIGAAINAATIIFRDSDGTGIGLGDTAVINGFNVSVAEFNFLDATTKADFATTGNITVDNISDAVGASDVTLLTLDAAGSIAFSGAATSVLALSAEADDGISITQSLTTVAGALALDGDADDAADTLDNIVISAGLSLTSADSLTLTANSGGITAQGAASLFAANGVTIANAMTATAGTLTVAADTDANGSGTFTTSTGALLDATGQTVDILSADVSLGEVLRASTVNVTASNAGDVDLGDATDGGELRLDRGELERIEASTQLEIITTGGGDVYAANILARNTDDIAHFIIDSADNVTFKTNASSFERLTVENGGAGADTTTIDGVNITTDGGAIVFTGDVLVTSSAASISNGGGVAGNITFNNDLTLDNADAGQDLSITAGSGNVAFTGAVTVNSSDLTVSSSTITTVTAGISGSTGAVDFTTSTRTDVDGAIALSGAGTVTLDAATISGVNVTTVAGAIGFSGAVNLDTAAVAVSTGGGAGTITFGSTVDGGQDLTLTAGAGNVDFDGAVGFTTDLGAVLVNSAANVTADSTFEASSFTQSSDSGTTTFSGLIDLATNFAFTGQDLTVNAAGNTVAGNMTVTNAGTFTTADASTIVVTGAFLQNGAGASSIGGNLTGTTDLTFQQGDHLDRC